ncbi:MAG: diguanylate cyclase [Candidatus Muiribacteriaceae bacterium]
MRNKRSISRKLSLVTGGLVVFSFIIVLLFVLFSFEQYSKSRVEERFMEKKDIFKKLFFSEFDDYWDRVRMIAKNTDLVENIGQNEKYAVYGRLADLRRDMGFEQSMFTLVLLSERSEIIAKIPGESEVKLPDLVVNGLVSGNTGRGFFTDGQSLRHISYDQIYHDDGSIIGKVLCIVNIDGNYIKDFLTRFQGDLCLQIGGEVIAGSLSAEELSDEDLILAYFPVTQSDVNLILAENISFIRESVRETRLLLVKVFIIIIAITLFAAGRLSVNFTRPLLILSGWAEKISDGDLSESIDIRRDDEIGILASTMDDMREKLRKNIREIRNTNRELDRKVFELSILNELNVRLNYLKDYRQVFRVLLDHIISTLDVERVSVMLLEDETLTCIECDVGGEFIETVPSLRLVMSQGAAGKAVQKKKPVVVNDASHSSVFTAHHKNPYVRNIICYPFFIKDNISGVFNIINRKNGFRAEHVRLLGLIISQGLISIDNARLYELAITDGLTGLYNHSYFQVRLNEEISKAGRYEARLSFAIMDIDHFKDFNDTYGHQTGDRVLRLVAETIEDNIRKGVDISARYGGEEFAVIMPDTDSEGAYVLCSRIREKIRDIEFFHNDEKLGVTISIGIATFPDHAETGMDLILKADNALYVSKDTGRDRVTLSE